MISEKLANEQLDRLGQLPRRPQTEVEFREMRMALMCAETDGVAITVIDAWVGYQSQWPMPAELRALVHQENEKSERNAPRGPCRICGGSQWVTRWFLITLAENGFTPVKGRTQMMPEDFDAEQATAFEERLIAAKANQTLLTGAVRCRCARSVKKIEAA